MPVTLLETKLEVNDEKFGDRNAEVHLGPRGAVPKSEPTAASEDPNSAVLHRDGVDFVARGGTLTPGLVDSHTHPVFAGDRADEFDARMNGEKYDGGGIRRTMAATRAASDADLHAMVTAVVNEMLRQGTTTVEGKTGYGLDVDTAVDGKDGLAKLKASPGIKLVISDVNMPNMDGLTMVEKIRGELANTTVNVIMLTTESSPAMKESPAPTVSTTSTRRPRAVIRRPEGRIASAPAGPIVQTARAGPRSHHERRRSAMPVGSSGRSRSHSRSASLALTTSLTATRRSTSSRTRSRSGMRAGRMLGS